MECKKCSSKWSTLWKMKRGRPEDWHIPGTVVRNAKRYEVCCYALQCWRSTVQCHLPCWKISEMPTPWARSILIMRGVVSCLRPCYMRFLFNIQKPETIRVKTVQFLAEKNFPKHSNVVDKSSQKKLWAWTLKWCQTRALIYPPCEKVGIVHRGRIPLKYYTRTK